MGHFRHENNMHDSTVRARTLTCISSRSTGPQLARGGDSDDQHRAAAQAASFFRAVVRCIASGSGVATVACVACMVYKQQHMPVPHANGTCDGHRISLPLQLPVVLLLSQTRGANGKS